VILVGTSGFSFEDWNGVFYPPYLKSGDRFAWYIRHFPSLEVNATYYRIPSSRTFEKWARVSPDGYPFIVKLHGNVTHKRREPRDSILELLHAVDPLHRTGRLAGILAQFPWGFQEGEEERRYLSSIRSWLPDDQPLFAEFRNERWNKPDTYRFLEDERIGFCCVDEPKLEGLMPPVTKQTNGTGYVRLHGRNAETWWGGGEEEGKGDRYDHLYTEEELSEWVDRVRELERMTDRTYLFFNNCHAGQAVRGAKRMQELLGIPLTGDEAQTLF